MLLEVDGLAFGVDELREPAPVYVGRDADKSSLYALASPVRPDEGRALGAQPAKKRATRPISKTRNDFMGAVNQHKLTDNFGG